MPSSTPVWSYDLIADVYATDMGQSMPFDDAGFYRDVATRHPGPVLELGCGTGRILLTLLGAGLDIVGVDRSLPMLLELRRTARERGLREPPLAQMDLAAPALQGHYGTILAPYSLVTYLTDPERVVQVLANLRTRLAAGGCIVLDAFVPKPVASFADYRLDYRRPYRDGTLERMKRITAHDDGRNRIERRYRWLDASGAVVRTIDTDETIRPYPEHELLALATRAGLAARSRTYDYGSTDATGEPRFVTLVLDPA